MPRPPIPFLLLAAAALVGCPGEGPEPSRELLFAPAQLPEGKVGQPYQAAIQISNTHTPVGEIRISQGTLPAGLAFAFRKDQRSAEIAGTPTEAGRSTITIDVWCYGTQRSGQTGQKTYDLVVR